VGGGPFFVRSGRAWAGREKPLIVVAPEMNRIYYGSVSPSSNSREVTMKESFEVYVNSNEMPWQPATDYAEGTEIKVLSDHEGRKTVLLKLPPGYKMHEHTHTCIEQHYVLEGQYEIGDRKFGAGSYQMIPAGETHGPFTSETGAVILVIWDPV